MARFYRTATPYFVQDGIYNPPVEMMRGLIERKDIWNDEMLKHADLLDNTLTDFPHLDMDREYVQKMQRELGEEVGGLVGALSEDPGNYQRYMPEINRLRKKIAAEMSTGQLSVIKKNAEAWAKHLEDNKEGLAADKETGNRFNQHLYEDLRKRREKDPMATFTGQRMAYLPDLAEKYTKMFEKVKADYRLESDGYYHRGKEKVSRERIHGIVMDMLMADPNVVGYMRQDHMLGGRRFIDDKGNAVLFYRTVDGRGNAISSEEAASRRENYENMLSELQHLLGRELDKTEEARKKVLEDSLRKAQAGLGREVINPEHGFSHLARGLGNIFAYEKDDIKVDEYGKMGEQFKYDEMAAINKHKRDMQLMVDEYMLKEDLERSNDLEKARKACDDSKDPNSLHCQHYNSLTNIESVIGLVGMPPTLRALSAAWAWAAERTSSTCGTSPTVPRGKC